MADRKFKKSWIALLAAAALTAGALAPSASSPTVTEAIVYGVPIDREQLVAPLIEAYGLNMLMQLIQLQAARHDAQMAKIAVTAQDISAERAILMKGLAADADPKDYDQLLTQLLQQQGISHAQFDIVVETNAILRKMAEPLCAGKISDANVKQAFDLQYGAKVQIRDIKVNRLLDAQQARQMLARGVLFEQVAQQLSVDPQTRALGGLWPPFSDASSEVSDAIKEQAFALKEGDISDVISTDNVYHVIKVEKKFDPAFAKFDEPTKVYLRKQLEEKLLQGEIKYLRANLAREVIQPGVLDIKDPQLKAQFDARLAERQRQAKENEKASQEQMLRHLIPSSQPTTHP